MRIKKTNHQVTKFFIMIGILTVTQIFVSFVPRSLASIGPLIESDLNLEKLQIGLFTAALFLGQAISSFPTGFIVDRLGTRILILVLSLTIGLSFVTVTFTNQYWLILLCVAIGGIGYGGYFPTSNRGIIYWAPVQYRGTAMGIKMMGVTLGSSLAALTLIPLSLLWGWRTALFYASLLLIVVGLISYKFYKNSPEEDNKQNTNNITETFLKLAKNKMLISLSFSALGLLGTQMCLNTYIIFFAYEELKFNLYSAGLCLVLVDIGGSAGRILWGLISDRLFQGNRIVILKLVASITALCSIAFTLLTPETNRVFIVLLILIIGFCVNGCNGIWMSAATESLGKEESGVASGFTLSLASWGVIIVPPLFGWIIDHTNSYQLSWLFITVLMLFVFILLQTIKYEGSPKA